MFALHSLPAIILLSVTFVVADETPRPSEVEGNPNGLISWILGFGRPGKPATPDPTTSYPEPSKPCDCKCGIPHVGQRIVGGSESKVNFFGWMAMLLHQTRFYCGGALISRNYVLTAAHCVNGISINRMTVRLLEHDRSSSSESSTITVGVAEVIMHKNYKSSTFNNDIALVRLKRDVDIDGALRPVCLPRRGLSYSGMTGIVTGWGKTSEGAPTSNYLQEVQVPIYSNAQCKSDSYYGSTRITDNMMCAGYKSGSKDSCQGDSGGPMHVDNNGSYEIVGIVSWGEGCARPGYPGVYTRVNRYLTWIEKKTNGSCFCTP